MSPPDPSIVRFGAYEVNLRSGDLRKDGVRIRLQQQPFQILTMLLGRPGEIVTREELQKAIWPADTFVDFGVGLDAAIYKLRQALDDSADHPRYLETVPRRGYRFIAPITAPPVARRNGLRAAVASLIVLGSLAVIAVAVRHRTRPASQSKVMLAVLPFENFSGNAEDEYISDGLTDEVIARLGAWNPQRLGVIARTSAMRYKKARKGIDEIGRELNVNYVLESSVRRSTSRVRVVVQLIQVRDQTHIWAESYDYPSAPDLVRMQEDLANRVAPAIAGKLLLGRAATAERDTSNPAAREAFLKGRFAMARRTPDSLWRAAAYFSEAAKHDPEFALAYSGLADASVLIGFFGMSPVPAEETRSQARAAALRAVELAPELAESHTSLGFYLARFEFDWSGAEREFKHAIRINPNHAAAHHWYANTLMSLGRLDEARAEILRARELDPVSPVIETTASLQSLFARRPDDCIRDNQRALELDPEFAIAHIIKARALEQKGAYREAIASSERAIELAGRTPLYLGTLGYEYAMAGDTTRARAVLRELEALLPRGYGAESMAKIFVGLKDYDKAIRYLETAYEQRSADMVYVAVEPKFDSLRADPRFRALLRKMHLGA